VPEGRREGRRASVWARDRELRRREIKKGHLLLLFFYGMCSCLPENCAAVMALAT